MTIDAEKSRNTPLTRDLDAIDTRLIEELKISGRESLANLGSIVGLTGDSVRERLNRLTSFGVIKVTCSVDPLVLGYRSITLIGVKVNGKALAIAESLAQVPEFDFVGCTAGEHDILVEAVCKDEMHLLSIVDEHIRSRSDVVSISCFNYLSVLKFEPGGSSPLRELSGQSPQALDDFDLEIIKALQADGRASFQEIAERIGMPYQTTRRRAKILLDSGVVRIETLVNRLVDGTAVVAGVGLRTTGSLASIVSEIVKIAEVEIAVHTTGSFDVMLEVACRDREHLARLVGTVLPSIPGVVSTETSIYQHVVKLPQSWSGLVRQL